MTDAKNNSIIIRPGSETDLPALTDLYNHYILNTHFTFDIEPKSIEDRRTNWFPQFNPDTRYQLFIAIHQTNNQILGYCSSTPFKQKRAYETSVETTIYLQPNLTHQNGPRSPHR